MLALSGAACLTHREDEHGNSQVAVAMGGRQLWLSCFFAALVLGVVFTPARAQIIGEEGLTEEQQEYFRNIFLQYDEDSDGYISMEENLKQDKVIADDEGKPFDEVRAAARKEQIRKRKTGRERKNWMMRCECHQGLAVELVAISSHWLRVCVGVVTDGVFGRSTRSCRSSAPTMTKTVMFLLRR